SAAKTMRRIDLADKVGMSASGITRLLNPMEKIKIVKKEINARDARVSFVKITIAGEELYNNALKSVELCSKEFFEDLNNNDIVKFLEILKKIR
ncbi:MAG: MarR family winged helix-turn-helix transcriptional regulator, partial [Thiovulaceae bacterium]|nr:MarR family winged helix-turn-helix transcriptional regulator [Sulfurimonadaceae bacterium]